jgi:hypothetical protein
VRVANGLDSDASTNLDIVSDLMDRPPTCSKRSLVVASCVHVNAFCRYESMLFSSDFDVSARQSALSHSRNDHGAS